jgi:hypothetical protein
LLVLVAVPFEQNWRRLIICSGGQWNIENMTRAGRLNEKCSRILGWAKTPPLVRLAVIAARAGELS